jgi:hypothetical protein
VVYVAPGQPLSIDEVIELISKNAVAAKDAVEYHLDQQIQSGEDENRDCLQCFVMFCLVGQTLIVQLNSPIVSASLNPRRLLGASGGHPSLQLLSIRFWAISIVYYCKIF